MIELGEEDGVALIRMADGKANAMSLEFCQALTARFRDCLLYTSPSPRDS